HQPVVDVFEIGTSDPESIDLDTPCCEPVYKRQNDLFSVPEIHACIDHIDADDSKRHLLEQGVVVVHLYMDHAIIWFTFRPQLKTNAHPSMALVCLLIVDGLHSVGKRKKTGIRNPVRKPLPQQRVFVIEHLHESTLAYVSFTTTVDRVAEFHVIGGDCLGHRA